MGEIKATSSDTETLVKLLFQETSIPTVPTTELTNFEYWFHNKTTLQGIAREPNISASNNRDWEIVKNPPLTDSSAASRSGLTYEGLFSI